MHICLGITSLIFGEQLIPLPTALELAEKELMGEYSSLWPLTKILDIGGTERLPNITGASSKTGNWHLIFSFQVSTVWC